MTFDDYANEIAQRDATTQYRPLTDESEDASGDGIVFADESEWTDEYDDEDEPSYDDPNYEAEMNLRAMQDERESKWQDPDCDCTSSNGDKYCSLHGETPGY